MWVFPLCKHTSKYTWNFFCRGFYEKRKRKKKEDTPNFSSFESVDYIRFFWNYKITLYNLMSKYITKIPLLLAIYTPQIFLYLHNSRGLRVWIVDITIAINHWRVAGHYWVRLSMVWFFYEQCFVGLSFGFFLFFPIMFGSNFWMFYLIRTSFTLDEPVSLVKVFRPFKLERIFWCSECEHSRYNILSIGSMFMMPCIMEKMAQNHHISRFSETPT